jgi:hypothetical protein
MHTHFITGSSVDFVSYWGCRPEAIRTREATTASLLASSMEKHDHALVVYEHCLEKRKINYGVEYPDYLNSLHNFAVSLIHNRDLGRALPILEECAAQAARIHGQDHPQALASVYCLAYLLRKKHEGSRAHPLYEDYLAMHERLYGDKHPRARH